jgi:hypothetical protein
MDLEAELRQRAWPTPVRGMDACRYDRSRYVREGRVVNRVLGLHEDLSEPIPAGECAITSLCRARNGKVYGATSGRRSHLFVYDPEPGADGVIDIGVIPGAKAVRRSLVALADGRVLGGVSETDGGNGGGALFVYETRRDHMVEYGSGHGEIEMRGVPVESEGIAALVASPVGTVFGLSRTTGTLFAYDAEADSASVVGRVDKGGTFSHVLVCDDAGSVFGAGACGRLFRYRPGAQEVEWLDVAIPTVAGRAFYNRLDSAAFDPVSGLIYGAGSADGVLFSFDPRTEDVRSLGKATAEQRCRALAVGLDGTVYGLNGDVDGMAHLFRYDPERHELVDLGMPMAAVQRFWHGYEFDAACTGRSGEIYLGESDRVAHLFIYFPPVRKKGDGALF